MFMNKISCVYKLFVIGLMLMVSDVAIGKVLINGGGHETAPNGKDFALSFNATITDDENPMCGAAKGHALLRDITADEINFGPIDCACAQQLDAGLTVWVLFTPKDTKKKDPRSVYDVFQILDNGSGNDLFTAARINPDDVASGLDLEALRSLVCNPDGNADLVEDFGFTYVPLEGNVSVIEVD